jgi:hypothetical protein
VPKELGRLAGAVARDLVPTGPVGLGDEPDGTSLFGADEAVFHTVKLDHLAATRGPDRARRSRIRPFADIARVDLCIIWSALGKHAPPIF